MKFALLLICIYEYLKFYYTPINQMYYEPWKFKFEDVEIKDSKENNIEKIKREKMVVAVDFDGTIARTDFPKIIEPIPYAFDVLRVLMNDKYTSLILWTCREGKDLDDAINFCELYGITFDYVNENDKERTEYYGNNSRKIGADLYIDDKSAQSNVEKLWKDWWDWLCDNQL